MRTLRRPKARFYRYGGLLAGMLMLPATEADHLEAKMLGVTDWTTECPANDLSYWDDMVSFWYNEIDDHGWYHRDGSTVDGDLDRSKLCDPDQQTPCSDHVFSDDADAVMVFMHGFDAGDTWGGALRRNGGPNVNDCDVNFPNASDNGDVFMGDIDAEFLHLSSCNSLDADNLANSWRAFRDPVDSEINGRRLHQVTGFHGFMWIGGCCDDQYEDFADDAHSVSIKDAWMDTMYVTGINGSSTQCPVAYAVGSNATDCFNRIDHERYNNVFSDPASIGYYCYYYYPGCDPEGEGPF